MSGKQPAMPIVFIKPMYTPHESRQTSTDSFCEIRTHGSTAPNAFKHIAGGIDYSNLPFDRFLETTMHCNYHEFPKTICHFVSYQRRTFEHI